MSLQDFLQSKAEEIAAACKEVLGTEAIEVTSHRRLIWNDDGSGTWWMHVGVFHEFRIVQVEERNRFGFRWWRYRHEEWLVRIGGHEFFEDGYLLESWCTVYDERLAEFVKPIVEPIKSWLGFFQRVPIKFTVFPRSSPP